MNQAKVAYCLAEVVRMTGLGRTSLYAEIKTGRLVARKLGRRTVILSADLEDFLRTLPALGKSLELGCVPAQRERAAKELNR